MSEQAQYPLPPRWGWASIEDVTSYVQRGKSPRYVERSELPVINQRCVRWHGIQTEHLKFIDPSQWDAWGPERTLQDGDVLWNSTGTGTIGRAAIYRPLTGFGRVVADSHVTVLRAKTVLPEYLHAWIRSPLVQSRIEAMQVGSTNQVELGRGEVLRTRIPLSPVGEQRRIVAKLEALQTRSRRTREALDAVPPLLEKLRQSILASAFRGDLTKDWRQQENLEPATELLKRIRTARRQKWEATELAKLKFKGKPPADDKWKARYKEPQAADTASLPALPDGWCWATVEELSTKVVDGVHQKPNYVPDGVPFLTVRNLTAGTGISFERLNYISTEDHEEFVKRADPERGDILISKDGTLGVTRLVSIDTVFSIFVSLALVKPVHRDMGEYMEKALWSPIFQERFKATGSGLLHIHLVDLRSAVLPICPASEQAVLLKKINRALTTLESLMDGHNAAMEQISTLDRTVLAKAFRGELVPQDPNDEPAEAMLARMRATSSSALANSTPQKRGRPRASQRADQPND